MSRPYTHLRERQTQSDDHLSVRDRFDVYVERFVNPVPGAQELPKNIIAFPGVRMEPRWNERIGVQIGLVVLATIAINLTLILVFAGIL